MRLKNIVVLLLIALSAASNAQERRFFDSPFGLGFGYTPVWRIGNLDELNTRLKATGFPEIATSGNYGNGFSGYIYLGFIPNLRIGGQGFGGKTEKSISVNGTTSRVEYGFSYGGFTAEYTLPFIRSAAVSVGLMIGGGMNTFTTNRYSGDATWNGIWNGYADTTKQSSSFHSFENTFVALTPTLTVDIPFYRFFAFRIGGGYSFTLSDNPVLDNVRAVSGVPSQFNGNSYYIQAGILAGFFAF